MRLGIVELRREKRQCVRLCDKSRYKGSGSRVFRFNGCGIGEINMKLAKRHRMKEKGQGIGDQHSEREFQLGVCIQWEFRAKGLDDRFLIKQRGWERVRRGGRECDLIQ